MRYHEDFEKHKGSFTPTTSDPVTDRVKKNTQDFSDISYRGIQRRVVEMERRRAIEHDQETITGTATTHSLKRVSRPGAVCVRVDVDTKLKVPYSPFFQIFIFNPDSSNLS